MKPSILSPKKLIRFVLPIVLMELAMFAVAGVVYWAKEWNGLEEYGTGLIWMGFLAGFSGLGLYSFREREFEKPPQRRHAYEEERRPGRYRETMDAATQQFKGRLLLQVTLASLLAIAAGIFIQAHFG